MKKIVIMLIVALSSGMSQTSQDNYSAQQENAEIAHKNSFFDASQPTDEYGYNEESQSDIDDYDQHVCDDVQPPKISAAKALLTEILGSLLIRYITLREVAQIYFKDFKDVIGKWFNSIVKP